jgi:NAD(P)H-dependent flavin oxidoreductase YrpB (nitropropane dioxygenase family)
MDTIRTDVCDLLEIEYPIVQGAMGPSGTVELACAVSEAGGLGMMSIGSETAGERDARRAFSESFDYMTSHTDQPFGVNIPVGSAEMSANVVETLDGYLEEVLVSKLTDVDVGEQLTLLETSAGSPERWIDKIQDVTADTDLVHFHKVGNVKHAKRAAELGVDGITASGFEMGGHTHAEDDAAHTFVLLPAVTEAVDVPVLASGGVRDGRGLLAALSLGAEGVYMGSRFMLTEEADFDDSYKEYVLDAGPGSDTLVEGVFGPLRAFESPGIAELEAKRDEMGVAEFNDFKDRKLIQAQQGDLESGVVLGGQVAGYIEDKPTVEELVQRIVEEALTAYDDLPVER